MRRLLAELMSGQTADRRRALPVYAHPSLESVVTELAAAAPHLRLELNPQVSTESQQLEEQAKKDIREQLLEDLERDAINAQPTGPMQLFLLNGNGLADGDGHTTSMMRAMAAAALRDPHNTVAAFLPQKNGETIKDIPDGFPEAVQEVMTAFLDDQKVTTLEGYDELTAWLATL